MQPPFLQKLVDALAHERVRFVVIGGVALNLQGYARATEDFDVCYARDRENHEALARALSPFHPRLRGAPEGSRSSSMRARSGPASISRSPPMRGHGAGRVRCGRRARGRVLALRPHRARAQPRGPRAVEAGGRTTEGSRGPREHRRAQETARLKAQSSTVMRTGALTSVPLARTALMTCTPGVSDHRASWGYPTRATG